MGRRSLESSYTNMVACLSSRFRKRDNGHKNHNNPFCGFHPSTSPSTHPICSPSDQELCDWVMKDKKPGKHLSGFRLVQAGVAKGPFILLKHGKGEAPTGNRGFSCLKESKACDIAFGQICSKPHRKRSIVKLRDSCSRWIIMSDVDRNWFRLFLSHSGPVLHSVHPKSLTWLFLVCNCKVQHS